MSELVTVTGYMHEFISLVEYSAPLGCDSARIHFAKSLSNDGLKFKTSLLC